jgi:beta-lactamase class A
MRRLAAAALTAALVWPASAAAVEERGWKPGIRAAREFAAERQGTISFAVRSAHDFRGHAADRTFSSASVVKAMLLVAYLREPGVRERALRADERGLLAPMIRSSDNAAATAIRDRIGSAALSRLADAAGMTRFAPAGAWGLSTITARDQTRLFLRIEKLMPDRHRRYALRLLRTIVPSQRWGVARVKPDGWRLYFKGGWGAGIGTVNHQVALLRRREARIAVAVLTTSAPSHEYGTDTLRGVFRRLLRGLQPHLRGTAGRSRAEL